MTTITEDELVASFEAQFELHRGRSDYFYSDCGGRLSLDWQNVYEKLLDCFDPSQREQLENQVNSLFSQPGTHRIMDQGCGHAMSLNETTLRFAREHPNQHFEGYGLSTSIEDIWIGSKAEFNSLTSEEFDLLEKHGIRALKLLTAPENTAFFGIEKDLHTALRNFPYNLDLVFSDNTYFHLVVPWMAAKHTAERLTRGGIALFRTIFQNRIIDTSTEPILEAELVKHLQDNNPGYEILTSSPRYGRLVLAIIKQKDSPFITNQHIGWKHNDSGRYLKTVYSEHLQKGMIAIDDF
ncbi:hypothetical protein COV18_01430 [Candidatus Woesearchaeota archaeon CG10_big_fil_rev_8_21_14_0_10_37_12]|nr:MAG: hypothetical protein COV18_01430 [Candidatus Woesearchaeota archaeon CG10_big_fil_rev_8_21_14_0_10_37_12]